MKIFSQLIKLSLALLIFSISACTSSTDAPQKTASISSPSSSKNTTDNPAKPIEVIGDFNILEPLFHQQSDTTYVINFWATWCKPCVEELPYFEQLHQKFSGEKIKVILVSLDFPKDYEKKLKPFVKEHKLQSEVILLTDGDYNTWIDKVSPEWGGAIPVTVVYKADKRKFVGEQFANYEELDALVRSFL